MSATAVTGSMSGKIVLVTGGTRGIGRATAIGLASMGARVGITGRDRTRAEAAAAAIVRASGNQAVDVFVADMPLRRRSDGWPARCSPDIRALTFSSTTSAGSGRTATGPSTVWSARSPSTTSRRSS